MVVNLEGRVNSGFDQSFLADDPGWQALPSAACEPQFSLNIFTSIHVTIGQAGLLYWRCKHRYAHQNDFPSPQPATGSTAPQISPARHFVGVPRKTLEGRYLSSQTNLMANLACIASGWSILRGLALSGYSDSSGRDERGDRATYRTIGNLALTLLLTCPAEVAAADDSAALRQELEVERHRLAEQMQLLQEQMSELKRQSDRLDALEQRLKESELAQSRDEDTESAESLALTPPAETNGTRDDAAMTALSGDVRETHELFTRSELVSDEFPGSSPMFGTDLRMKVGGYIKTDFVADFDGTLDSTQFLMRTIPVKGTPDYGDDPYVEFFAKETRFNLDIRRTLPGSVPLRGFIEGDFFSSGNDFRLRHAYVTAGDFIVGQTWTTLSFLEAMPYMIDFAAGDALYGGRAAQLRYQHSLSERWKLSLALEELQFLGIQNANNLPGKATSQWPLLAFRADYRYDSGLLLMGASFGQLHWDGSSGGPSDSAIQVAALLAGRQNLTERAYATWHLSYSEGAGENIMAFAGTDANAVLNARGKLETFPAFATVLGLGYDWTSTLSSNISYAYGWLDTPDSRAPLALKRGGIGHLNLIWRPNQNKHFSTGAEIMWGETRVQNNSTGNASRLQLMAKFEF